MIAEVAGGGSQWLRFYAPVDARRGEWDMARQTLIVTLRQVGSEAGSYLRLIVFVYHSTLGLRVIKKKKKKKRKT